MTKKELLNKLYKDYDMTSEDAFKHNQGWVILTRSGIEKIQAKDNIEVTYEVVRMEPDYAVIKAVTDKVSTFGSAKHGKYGQGTTLSLYIAEMAEKRALSRAILKHTGMYQFGAFGEDEADDFKDDRKELTSQVINRANNAVTRGEKTAEEVIDALEDQGYIVGETMKYAWRKIKPINEES